MLIGRKPEIKRLEKAYKSNEAEFVVLYGRRRVGKTFLVRESFSKRDCHFFYATGLQNGALKKQLAHFAENLALPFTHGIAIKPPESWDEAFKILTQFIESSTSKRKTVIFLDELPWMATRRSGLLEALDYYWNHHWSKNPSILLIVCGSSASWLINNIIYNRGGLHNRCTCEIKLDPFTLSEAEAFLISRGVKLNRKHIVALYMALGGIPYYLKYVEPNLTAAENVQDIFFDKKSPLRDEFNKLFHSLFHNADAYIELIKLIADKKEGVSRTFLEEKTISSRGGGRLTQRLNQLIQTNFIEAYLPWNKQRGEYYKLIDEFCLFHIYWMCVKRRGQVTRDHWLKQEKKPIYQVWSGYAFEAICRKHIDQIISALHIKTAETIASWRFVPKKSEKEGAQIDLLIDRDDDAITICEIKYTGKPFVIDKAYAGNLTRKIEVFTQKTQTTKQIFLSLISANGVKKNKYSQNLVNSVVILDDLFGEI